MAAYLVAAAYIPPRNRSARYTGHGAASADLEIDARNREYYDIVTRGSMYGRLLLPPNKEIHAVRHTLGSLTRLIDHISQ